MKNKFKDFFEAMEDWVSGGLLFAGLTMIFIGVFYRYVLNSPLHWVDELSKFTIIWGTLIGCSVALRDNHHIKVDILYDRLPRVAQKCVTLFADIVGLLYCAFLVKYGWELVQFRIQTGQATMDLAIPIWIPYLILPLTGLLMGSRYVVKFYYDLITKASDREVKHVDHSSL